MTRLPATEREIERRIDELCSHFVDYVSEFEESDRFAGPSLYFHQKTIERRRCF